MNVEVVEGSGVPLVFLHGWGGNARSFGGAIRHFAECGRMCVALDFPPFGASDEPPPTWSLRDYTVMTESALTALGIPNAVLIGHSFGGRVAVDFASRSNRARKLVLVDAAGLKPKRGWAYRRKMRRFRRDKAAGRDTRKYYSPDYLAMPERLRGVFSRVVAEDLSDRLPLVSCPTLIVWGRTDAETPPEMAKRMKKGIADSRLVWLDGGHFAYAEKHFAFLSALDEFLGDTWK